MKSLLEEIRQQPEHIRHVFMWLMVVICFSVIGFVWFRSTSKQFVALLHPETAQDQALADSNKPKQPSPFATIFNSFKDLQANISELISGKPASLDINNGQNTQTEIVPPKKLPLSD
jgi:hypothetical protein